jgi:hypothetical protein
MSLRIGDNTIYTATSVTLPDGYIDGYEFVAPADGFVEHLYFRTNATAPTCTSLVLGVFDLLTGDTADWNYTTSIAASSWLTTTSLYAQVTAGRTYLLTIQPLGGTVSYDVADTGGLGRRSTAAAAEGIGTFPASDAHNVGPASIYGLEAATVQSHGLRFQFTGLWKPGETTVPFYGTVSDPLAGEVVIPLNDSRTASVTVSTRDPVIEVLEALPQQTHAVFLKVFYEGNLVFWGPVKVRSPELAAGTVRFDAVDMTLRLINHMLRRGDELADGPLAQANQDKGYVPVSQAGLMMLVAAADTDSFPKLGIVSGTDSFGDAVHLIGFERGNPIYTAWQQVADSLGPDWSLDPVDTLPQTYAALNTFDHQGSDVSALVQLHYGCGHMNLESFSFSEGEEYVNLVHVLDRDNKRQVPVANATALARTGPYIQWGATEYDITGLSDTDADAVLEAYGQDVIKAYSYPLLTVTVGLAVDTPDSLHFGIDFGMGDTVGIAGKDGFVEVPEAAYRITRWAATLDGQDGAVRQTLDVIPDRVGDDTIDETPV